MDIEEETDSEADGSGEDDVVDRVDSSMYRAQPASPDQDDDDEDEMSMEVTQNYGGGIISHQGLHPADESVDQTEEDSVSQANTSTASDMDFTVAIGGILPTVPPSGAQRGRASLGYSHLLPEDQQHDYLIPGEGDDEMEMDETVAFGGIIQADDSLSSMEDTMTHQHQHEATRTFSIDDLQRAAAEERSAMDMTVAGGGILSQPAQSLAVSHPTPRLHQPPTPKSPRSITRPMAGTPSFARPTASSASKSRERSPEKTERSEKRNIFGPSPSPFKSSTPRKSGMQTAGEVAKRLSFGSATSSVHGSAKKRPRQSAFGNDNKENEDEEPVHQRPRLGDSVFGPPAPAPAIAPEPSMARPEAPPTPVRSTPSKKRMSMAATASTTPAKSPARSPAIRRAMGVPDLPVEEERDEDWEPETIGVGAFLEMAGVQFIDTLPSMNRRRSSVARSRLAQSALARGESPLLQPLVEVEENTRRGSC